MTDTETRYAVSTLTWCLTTSGYADEATCFDPDTQSTRVDHDHYDVVVDQHGKTLFRVYPIGTVLRLPDGEYLRVRRYDADFNDMMFADETGEDARAVPKRPQYDVWVTSGGATSASWSPGLLDGAEVIIPVTPEGGRPAPGAMFVLPNGETWRLRNYSVDWRAEPFTGNDTRPSWTVTYPSGSSSTADGDLPAGARLVWHP